MHRAFQYRGAVFALVVAGLAAALSACQSGTGGDGTAAPPPAGQGGPATSAADTARSVAPPSPSVNQPPPDPSRCFVGSYTVASITGHQGITTPAGAARPAGGGGSLVFDLRADNTWQLSSDGSRPVVFEVGPYTVDAVINGTLKGSYQRSGSSFLFEQDDATGTVTLSTPIGSRDYDMDTVGPALAPSGTATVTCGADGAEFVSQSVTMTLKRR